MNAINATEKQAAFEAARDDLVQTLGDKLKEARARQEEARRALQAASAIIRDAHASQSDKVAAGDAATAAQRELAAATADADRLEVEHRQAREGHHPAIAREAFAAQQAHVHERMAAIEAAEAALLDGLRSDAVQAPLTALADLLGKTAALKRAADLLG